MAKKYISMDIVNQIMKYEAGEMDESEMIEFFQELVDTELAWKLQGSYGRTAADMIQQGLVTSVRFQPRRLIQ